MASTTPNSWSKTTRLIFLSLGSVGLLLPEHLLGGYTALIWLISVFFLGLPHGAADWIIHQKKLIHSDRASDATFVGAYLLMAAIYLGIWWFSAEVALLLFLMITAWHWGSADSLVFKQNSASWLMHSLFRGGLLMLAPFALHPERTAGFLRTFPGMSSLSIELEIVQFISYLALLCCTVGALFLVARGRIADWQQRGDRAGLLLEMLLILLFFWLLPPLLAIGIYFMAVHSLGHSMRLLETLKRHKPRHLKYSLYKLHTASAICTIPVILAILAWVLLNPDQFNGIPGSIANYLVIIASLTLPHAALITVWDLSESKQSKLDPRQTL